MISFTQNPITKIEALSFEEYRSDDARPGINQSLLKIYDRDLGGAPAKYRHYCLHPEERPEPSAAMEFGTAYHCVTLTPEEFEKRYVICTRAIEDELLAAAQAGQGKKKSEKFSRSLGVYKAWESDQLAGGKKVVTQRQADTLERMREALMACPEVREAGVFADDTAKEVSLFARYELGKAEIGKLKAEMFQLKGRVDLLPVGDAIIDLKSARSAHPREFARAVADQGLDIQAAFYIDLARANRIDKKRFGFLAQDKEPPYLACIHWLPAEWIAYGRLRYKEILCALAESIRLNDWPGYGSGVLAPPLWLQHTAQWELAEEKAVLAA